MKNRKWGMGGSQQKARLGPITVIASVGSWTSMAQFATLDRLVEEAHVDLYPPPTRLFPRPTKHFHAPTRANLAFVKAQRGPTGI